MISFKQHNLGVVASLILGIGIGLTCIKFIDNSVASVPDEKASQPQSVTLQPQTIIIKEQPQEQTAQQNPTSIDGFSDDQTKILKIAFEEGTSIGFPETIQAIALQESSAGVAKIGDLSLPVGKRSYGIMQIKVAAVRYVMKQYPEMKHYFGKDASVKISSILDEDIIVLLITNDRANIDFGTKFFHLLDKKTNNWSEAVTAYNQGLSGLKSINNPKNFQYTKNIISNIKSFIRPFNHEAGLMVATE